MSADDPIALMSFSLGPNTWPPDPAEAFAKVAISGVYKLDPQKPHGQDDADIKGVGREARKVTLTLRWSLRVDSEARAFIKQISPLGVNQGKAWEFVHPDAELYNVDTVELEEQGEIDRTPGDRTLTFKGLSWVKKKPLTVGKGAKTANKAQQWVDTPPRGSHVTVTTKDGNTIDMGPGPITVTTADGNTLGFNGAKAPKPSVP